jgi:hypothetical protein
MSADAFKVDPKDYLGPYQPSQSVQIGLKLYETIDDKYMFPLSLKIMDTPGALKEN